MYVAALIITIAGSMMTILIVRTIFAIDFEAIASVHASFD